MMKQFAKNIKILRNRNGLSQEQMAEQFGVSKQAISKWERALSYPDINLLFDIADYFEVTMDNLLREDIDGISKSKTHSISEALRDYIPNDRDYTIVEFKKEDVIYVVQVENSEILRRGNYNDQVLMPLSIDGDWEVSKIEIWGSAEIKGNVNGNVVAGGGVNCGNVNGRVEAADGVNCGNVTGNIDAGDGVNCGDVLGSVCAGDGVNCGDVACNASAGDDIHCNTILGNASCGGDIHYK